ncbi:MAG: hypothetical protein DWI22_19270 [Planctomycetota bacterium]|nr:MAG: hypothetical protein DWI22_19270 [Planctomycetota bacterium]
MPLLRGDFDDVPDLLGDVASDLLTNRRGVGDVDCRERLDCADTGVATDRLGYGPSCRYRHDLVVGVRPPLDGGRCPDGVGAGAAQWPYADRFSLEKGHENCRGLLPETPISSRRRPGVKHGGTVEYRWLTTCTAVDSNNFEKKFFENEIFFHRHLFDSSSVFRGSDWS